MTDKVRLGANFGHKLFMQKENDSEWSIPDPSIDVRQGDLLVSRSIQTGKIEELCLVITADCDISKGKFGRQLAVSVN